nr:MAG TPA: hypothetical protein [Caudoviricetes sp.]
MHSLIQKFLNVIAFLISQNMNLLDVHQNNLIMCFLWMLVANNATLLFAFLMSFHSSKVHQ